MIAGVTPPTEVAKKTMGQKKPTQSKFSNKGALSCRRRRPANSKLQKWTAKTREARYFVIELKKLAKVVLLSGVSLLMTAHYISCKMLK